MFTRLLKKADRFLRAELARAEHGRTLGPGTTPVQAPFARWNRSLVKAQSASSKSSTSSWRWVGAKADAPQAHIHTMLSYRYRSATLGNGIITHWSRAPGAWSNIVSQINPPDDAIF